MQEARVRAHEMARFELLADPGLQKKNRKNLPFKKKSCAHKKTTMHTKWRQCTRNNAHEMTPLGDRGHRFVFFF